MITNECCILQTLGLAVFAGDTVLEPDRTAEINDHPLLMDCSASFAVPVSPNILCLFRLDPLQTQSEML